MVSKFGKQIITIYILPNISRREGNWTIKLSNWGREISSWPPLFFKKVLHEVKASGLQLRFNIFWYNKNKLYKTLHYWSRDMLDFKFLEDGLVCSLYFVYYFLRKMLLMLYSINWPNFIAWLSLLLKILVNMCIAIVC